MNFQRISLLLSGYSKGTDPPQYPIKYFRTSSVQALADIGACLYGDRVCGALVFCATVRWTAVIQKSSLYFDLNPSQWRGASGLMPDIILVEGNVAWNYGQSGG